MHDKRSDLEAAQALLASPAGVEFAKYPMKFVVPAFFGSRPQPGTPAPVNSGSAALLRRNGQFLALTCFHVLEAFRQRLAEGPCILQLGDCELNPLEQLRQR